MAVEIVVRPVAEGDIEELAANIRPADLAECIASGYDDPLIALRHSCAWSTKSWTGTADGRVGCVMGVGPVSLLGGIGSPWLLGTAEIEKNAGAFIRRTMPYIQLMLKAYPHLVNHVDARNTRSVRWLKRVGFTMHAPVPYGPYQMPFHPFEMKA